MKKINVLFLISLLSLLSLTSIVSIGIGTPIGTIIEEPALFPNTSQLDPRNARVAIYNEPNTTRPAYSSAGILHNNYTAIKTLLEGAGYIVTELTETDILNHELKTAKYDVFLMADNLPRESIVNLVKEFWLGGGSIFSLDSTISYICYAGMIPPESEGSDNYLVYWSYAYTDEQNITVRHPVTKAYQVNDVINETFLDWGTFDWAALQGSSAASQMTKLATNLGNPNLATAVAFDPTDKGGRVVHMIGDGSKIGDNMDQLIIEAVEWLCPHPKAIIAFDLSHLPYYGIDAWDDLASFTPRFETLRNALVNRSYLFDKIYPSNLGNLTLENLEPYDILIIAAPIFNFSSAEVSAVQTWINNGGNMLVLGIRHSSGDFGDRAENLNYLLTDTDLKIRLLSSGAALVNFTVPHPTIEACTELDASYSAPGLINCTGVADPIWGNDASNIIIGAQEYGNGRVILSGDLFFLRDGDIYSQDNLQYAINMINWLSSSNSDVLLYVDEPFSPNYYQTPVARALNLLEIPFYLTFDSDYTNLSLHLYTWEMLIFDNGNYFIEDFLYDIADYIDAGGKLIMSTFTVDDYSTHPLWSRLGFELSANIPSEPTFHIWNPTHAIFTTPIAYGATNFLSDNSYGDDGDLLTVFSNATALAGFTPTEQPGNATIVLSNSGKTLFNSIIVNKYSLDTDDSTYEDRLELWMNEIEFIMTYTPPLGPGGIPGYELGILAFASIFAIGVVSILILKKKSIV